MFGRPFRLPCFANAVLAISLAIAVLAAPSSTNAAAMSLDDFGALPPADQRALLEKILRRRIELTQNVRFEIETAMFNAEVDELHYEFDPRLRDEEKKGYQRRYSQARIGASYLSKTTEISRDGRPAIKCVVNLFDARIGVNRGYVTHPEGQHTAHGRIGRYQDIVDTHNTYNFWYPGENRYFGNSLLAGLLSGLDGAEITVDRERGLVILRIRQSDASTGEIAETTVDIDPARTFLPVRFRRYITEKASGEYRFFVAFDVLQTRESKGLDLPVRIRQVISNGVERPGHQGAVYDIVVKNIEIGSVERSDLVLQFPANTRVINEIEGVAYTVGPDRSISGEVQPLVDDALRKPHEQLIGKPAPELPLDGWIGGSRPELAGRPYLVHFWAVWCAPCKGDFPDLRQLAEDGVTIVGVHPDGTSSEEVEQVLGEAKLGYPTVVAPLNAAKSTEAAVVGYPRNVVPYYVLVDADGQVIAHGFLSDDRLTIKLDELREAGQFD